KEVIYNECSKEVLSGEQVVEVLQVLADKLIHLDDFTAEEIKAKIKETQKETKNHGKKLFMPIRFATTGQKQDPELQTNIKLKRKKNTTYYKKQNNKTK